MAIDPEVISKANSAIDHREDELGKAIFTISLLKSAPDFLREKAIETYINNSGVTAPKELQAFIPQISTIVSDAFNKIPAESMGKLTKFSQEVGVLHSQFKMGTQQLLLGEKAAANISSLIAAARDNLHSDSGNFSTAIGGIKETALGFLDGIQQAAETTPGLRSFSSDLRSSLPELRAAVTEAQDKTVQLQSRVLSGGDFSPARISAIKTPLDAARALVPSMPAIVSLFSTGAPKTLMPTLASLSALMPGGTFGGASTAGSPTSGTVGGGSLLSEMTKIGAQFNKIMSTTTNMSTFKDDLPKAIKPGDLLKDNFSDVYSVFKNIKSGIETVGVNLDASTPANGMEALSAVMGQMSAITGIIQTLGNKQFQSDLGDNMNASVQKMNTFAGVLTGVLAPGGALDAVKTKVATMTNDVKAVGQIANRILKGKVPAVSTLLALKDRIMSTADTIQSGMSTFRTALNTFSPTVTTDSRAYLASVGEIGSAVKEAIMTMNASALNKTLQSPNELTVYGQMVTAMSTFLQANGQISVENAAIISVVTDTMRGLHDRQMTGNYLKNVAAQRSQAQIEAKINIKALDYLKMLVGLMANIKSTPKSN